MCTDTESSRNAGNGLEASNRISAQARILNLHQICLNRVFQVPHFAPYIEPLAVFFLRPTVLPEGES